MTCPGMHNQGWQIQLWKICNSKLLLLGHWSLKLVYIHTFTDIYYTHIKILLLGHELAANLGILSVFSILVQVSLACVLLLEAPKQVVDHVVCAILQEALRGLLHVCANLCVCVAC